MLYLLFFSTMFFVVVAATVRTGKMYNPLNFYIVFWGIWSIVSLTNPFGTYEVSTQTYLLVWVTTICFSLGYLLFYRSRKGKEATQSNKLNENKMLDTKMFLFIQILVFILLMYFYQKYSNILDSLTINDARNIVYEIGYLFTSTYDLIIFTWIITPIVYVSVLLLLSDFVMNGAKRFALYISLTNCLLFGLIGYGRFIYFQIIIYALVTLGFKYDMHKKILLHGGRIKNRTKILFALLIFTAVYFMNISSAKRIGKPINSISDHMDVFVNVSLNQLVVYFTGPFRALDYFIKSNVVEQTGYTYGRSFFAGIEEIINFFVIFIGHSTWNTANTISSTFTVDNIQISNSQTFNAFYTSIMNHYLDGGIWSVVISSFIFGIISVMFYNHYLRNPNLITLSLNVFLTYHMIATEFRWSFSSPTIWIAIAMLLWMNRRYNRKKQFVENSETELKAMNSPVIS